MSYPSPVSEYLDLCSLVCAALVLMGFVMGLLHAIVLLTDWLRSK